MRGIDSGQEVDVLHLEMLTEMNQITHSSQAMGQPFQFTITGALGHLYDLVSLEVFAKEWRDVRSGHNPDFTFRLRTSNLSGNPRGDNTIAQFGIPADYHYRSVIRFRVYVDAVK
jgi:hypothetical protein